MDTELRQFASDALKQMGGLLEEDDETLNVVLSSECARVLGSNDYVRLGEEAGETALVYGSPFLDKLIDWASKDRVFLTRPWMPRNLRTGDFGELVADTYSWLNATGRVVRSEEIETAYWIFHLYYTARSDEITHGLCPLVIHEEGLSSPLGFMDRLRGLELGKPLQKAPLSEDSLPKIFNQMKLIASQEVQSRLTEFFSSRERRLARDLRQLREYYCSQESEMGRHLKRQGLDEKNRVIREEKIARLPLERAAKEADIVNKYSIRVDIDCRTAMRLVTQAVRVTFELRRRKESRLIFLFWNPVTKRLDPLVCEGCGTNVYQLVTCDAPHLLCKACGEGCPVCRKGRNTEAMSPRLQKNAASTIYPEGQRSFGDFLPKGRSPLLAKHR